MSAGLNFNSPRSEIRFVLTFIRLFYCRVKENKFWKDIYIDIYIYNYFTLHSLKLMN